MAQSPEPFDLPSTRSGEQMSIEQPSSNANEPVRAHKDNIRRGSPTPPAPVPPSSPLHWSGVLTSIQLEDLTNRFGDLLMCPGFVGRWGKTSDAWGKLLVPGASSGLREAVKLWQGWDTKSSAQFGWWRGEVEKRAIRPITGRMVLEGLDSADWNDYRRCYHRVVGVRNQTAYKDRRKKASIAKAERSSTRDLAASLVGMGAQSLRPRSVRRERNEVGHRS